MVWKLYILSPNKLLLVTLLLPVLKKFLKLNIPKELREHFIFYINVQYSPPKNFRLIRSASVWQMARIFHLFFFINLWKFINSSIWFNGKYRVKCFLRSSLLLILMFFFFFSKFVISFPLFSFTDWSCGS